MLRPLLWWATRPPFLSLMQPPATVTGHMAGVPWGDDEAELRPNGLNLTIEEIWNAMIACIEEYAGKVKGSRSMTHADVVEVIERLGDSIKSNTWRVNCNRGWLRVHSFHPVTVECFFGVAAGQEFSSSAVLSK